MLISPSINIGLGELGKRCITGVKSHFFFREKSLLPYVSFHETSFKNEEILLCTVNTNGKFEQTDEKYNPNSFVQHAYNHLVTLLNQLEKEPDYSNVQFNFFLSSYDKISNEYLIQFIKEVENLANQGTIGAVGIKCFYLVSNGKDVVDSAENQATQKSLIDYCTISKNANISCHAFVIDNKNTQTVFLGRGFDYLWFAISEMLIALMTQQYGLLANLESELGVFSFGIGMVYFDELYFKAYFKNRILKRKLEIEEIGDDRYNFDSKESYKKFAYYDLNQFCKGKKNNWDVKAAIVNLLPKKENSSLGNYQYLLHKILYREPNTFEDLPEVGKYNLDDAIYTQLYNALEKEEIKKHGILTFTELEEKEKKLNERQNERFSSQDELNQLEAQLSSLKREVLTSQTKTTQQLEDEQALLDGKITHLKTDLQRINQLIRDQKDSIERHINSKENLIDTYGNRYKRAEFLLDLSKIEAEIEKNYLDKKRAISIIKDNYENASFLKKIIKRRTFKKTIDLAQEEIDKIVNQKDRVLEQKNRINSLGTLFGYRKNLKAELNAVESGINSLLELRKEFEKDLERIPFINLDYVQNILSTELMDLYESKNIKKLQNGLNNTLNKISLYQSTFDFKEKINTTIQENISRIIKFDMLKYLMGEYDTMQIFNESNFDSRFKNAKTSEHPFVNIKAGRKILLHHLTYYNDKVDREVADRIKKKLKEKYPTAIPGFILSESNQKFALITIGVIDNLDKIVKCGLQFNTDTKNIAYENLD